MAASSEQNSETPGKLISSLMNGNLANNWQNIKNTVKNKISEKLESSVSIGDTTLQKNGESNQKSYVFIEEPLVKEEILALQNKSKLQDFEALATKLEMN